MGKRFDSISEKYKSFISEQKIFFTGTAAADGRVNVSPKGMDSLRVIDDNTVVWLNLTGSGNETATHLLENDRMTIMFCAFDGPPTILRLYGHAKAVRPDDDEWSNYIDLFPKYRGVRQIMLMEVDLTFEWADVDADEYQLVIVNNQNTIFSEYFDGQTTSATVSNLPMNGAFLSVEIATRRGSLWSAQAYAIISNDVLPNAELLIHHDGDTLTSPEVDFRWTDVGADEYRIYIESNGSLIHDQLYDGETTSALIDNFPANGAKIFFLLYTRHGVGWALRTYDFTSQDALDNAYLLSHIDGDTLQSDSVMLTWLDVNADSYHLEIFSHSNELFSQSFDGQTTSAFIEGLPINGAELRIVLTTTHGQGSVSRTTYIKSQEILETSVFLGRVDGDIFRTRDIELHWSNVNADEYQIDIREDVEGGTLIYSERFDSQTTSTLIRYLPNEGERLFFRLSTRHGQGWADQHYEFSIVAED